MALPVTIFLATFRHRLAWTAVGGDTLQIETTAVPGTGKLVLTGQLGDVTQESAKAGISYIRCVADELGEVYKRQDIMFEIPSRDDVKKCIITRDTIEAETEPVLVYSDGKTNNEADAS